MKKASDVDAAANAAAFSLENLSNVKCYGQPEDCRGWRQFLVERCCPDLPPLPDPVDCIPCVLWVTSEPADGYSCPHVKYEVLPESRAKAYGEAPHSKTARYFVCVKQGRFIE